MAKYIVVIVRKREQKIFGNDIKKVHMQHRKKTPNLPSYEN